jgi:dienelactone hydrolase
MTSGNPVGWSCGVAARGHELILGFGVVMALILAAFAGCSSIVRAQAEQGAEVVHFPSVKGEPLELVGHLRRPDGAGPFPAVVLLHGCGGNWRGVDTRWGSRFVGWGYVALSVDSYGPRGIKSVCGFFDSGDPPDHMWDAYGALNFLVTQPFVAPGHVAVMGASGGATMALMDAEQNSGRGFPYQFRAAVALYPNCRVIHWRMTVPTLILIGELDNLTPAQPCQDLTQGYPNGSKDKNIRLVVFPGAYHAFDNTSFPRRTAFLGQYWLEYNADATKRSVAEIREFLRDRLDQ